MIPLPQPPKVIKKEGQRTTFEIAGLYPGYGVTLGNSLRRVLLSSLAGAAITQVKIKDVAHEFSTIPGVLEDVIVILLNLKKLRFKMHTAEPQKGLLKVKGKKDVKAKDFKLSSEVELISGDAPIATLTNSKAQLEMEIQIEKGIGYESVERRGKEKLEIGAIALDAIYTPIRNVVLRVENMRVLERTDFDRLFLEIETDATISPEEALRQACQILNSHFSLCSDFLKEEKPVFPRPKTKEKKKVAAKKKLPDPAEIKIEDLKLPTQLTNLLLENRIKTVAGLMRKNEESLLAIPGLGGKGLGEIKRALKKQSLGLKG